MTDRQELSEKVAELADPIDYEGVFATHFQRAVDTEQQFTSTPPQKWHRTGRASKQWPDKEGPEWWAANGPKMLQEYVAWRREFQLPVWVTPEGQPAIELDITTRSLSTVSPRGLPQNLPGLRAIIDRIFVDTETGALVIVDLKTGHRMPIRQLGFYKVAVEMQWPDVRITHGAWWQARKGRMTRLTDLTYYTPTVVAEIVWAYEQQRKVNPLIPSPNQMCSSCTVRQYCAEQGGVKAEDIPPF